MPIPSPRRRQAAEYRDRDLALLRFVYRYGIAINATISAALLAGKEAGHVMRRFGDRNWCTLHASAIPGGISYLTLTPQGAREIGKQIKAKPLGSVAIDAALAASYYAVLSTPGVRRYRLTTEELKKLCPGLAVNVPHLLTEEFGTPVVLRVIGAASGKPQAVLEKAQRFFDKALIDRRTAPWIQAGDLGLVLLGHTSERVQQLKDCLSKTSRFQNQRIVVGLGPTAETLAKCLRARRREQTDG